MSGKNAFSAAIFLALSIPAAARAEDFALGFDGYPSSPVEGQAGEMKTFEIYPTLTSSNIPAPHGAQGWAISIEIIGGTIQSIEQSGIIVDTVWDEYASIDGVLTLIERHVHYPVDLKDGLHPIAALATKGGDPSRKGAISAWITPSSTFLMPEGTQRIAKLLVQATIPDDEVGHEVVLRFEDGFRSELSQPVNNVITFGGRSHDPQRDECRFTVRKAPPLRLALGFEGCPPSTVEGAPGAIRTFEVFPTLTTAGNPGPDGPHSWAIGVGISGGAIKAIDLGGLLISTVFDHDGDPATPPLDPYYLDLETARPRDAELAASIDDPSRIGAISMVMLDRTRKMVLHPNGTQRVARIVVEAEVPRDDTPKEVVLRFEDGFGTRRNWINLDDVYAPPALGECRFTLKLGSPALRVPGDSDQSGSLDLSDAISLFGTLFQGSPERFPCGDGSPSDSGNKALLDWQDDGTVDISDGIAALRFLFLGGPAHRLAVPGDEIRGCVPVYGCPAGASCR